MMMYNTKNILPFPGDFPRAWALLLEMIEAGALCRNAEVSLAALKSFQEILHLRTDQSDGLKLLNPNIKVPEAPLSAPTQETILRSEEDEDETTVDDMEMLDVALWATAWKVWLNIGTMATIPPAANPSADMYIPSQPFLTALIQIFPALYEHIKARFVAGDLQKLSTVLQRALAVPVHGDSTPFIMPVGEVSLTTLQEAVLSAINVLCKVSVSLYSMK